MVFDAARFLEGLFDAPVVSGVDDTVPVLESNAVGHGVHAAPSFSDWTRRQDVTGRWGWEVAGLSEADRWWARFQFEDLPYLTIGK